MYPRGLLSPSPCFVLSSKNQRRTLSIGDVEKDLGETWANAAVGDGQPPETGCLAEGKIGKGYCCILTYKEAAEAEMGVIQG